MDFNFQWHSFVAMQYVYGWTMNINGKKHDHYYSTLYFTLGKEFTRSTYYAVVVQCGAVCVASLDIPYIASWLSIMQHLPRVKPGQCKCYSDLY